MASNYCFHSGGCGAARGSFNLEREGSACTEDVFFAFPTVGLPPPLFSSEQKGEYFLPKIQGDPTPTLLATGTHLWRMFVILKLLDLLPFCLLGGLGNPMLLSRKESVTHGDDTLLELALCQLIIIPVRMKTINHSRDRSWMTGRNKHHVIYLPVIVTQSHNHCIKILTVIFHVVRRGVRELREHCLLS